jgi:hypothetical protein
MKLIGTLQGISAIRYLPEEILPAKGVQQPALLALLRTTYRATPAPTIMARPIQHADISAMTFTNGRLEDGDTSYAISQMVISGNGLMIVSKSTDDSDKIYEHLTSMLDKTFGFKFKTFEPTKQYISTIVVQLETEIERATSPLNSILELLRLAMGEKDGFALKRLAFGSQHDGGPVITLDTLDKADFVLERRAGSPFAEKRYFSTAPLRTSEHIEVLGKIEEIIATSSGSS